MPAVTETVAGAGTAVEGAVRHVLLSAAAIASLTTTSAHGEYRLATCSAGERQVHLKFVAETGALRRITLGPKGVELGGDIKGASRLDGVRELRVAPGRVLIYAPKNGPEVKFGRLTDDCLTIVRSVAESLGKWKDG